MSKRTCDYCGDPFAQREAKHWFCTTSCRIAWFQNEKRAALEAYRQEQEIAEEARP